MRGALPRVEPPLFQPNPRRVRPSAIARQNQRELLPDPLFVPRGRTKRAGDPRIPHPPRGARGQSASNRRSHDRQSQLRAVVENPGLELEVPAPVLRERSGGKRLRPDLAVLGVLAEGWAGARTDEDDRDKTRENRRDE